jgi:hypothetical protein
MKRLFIALLLALTAIGGLTSADLAWAGDEATGSDSVQTP